MREKEEKKFTVEFEFQAHLVLLLALYGVTKLPEDQYRFAASSSEWMNELHSMRSRWHPGNEHREKEANTLVPLPGIHQPTAWKSVEDPDAEKHLPFSLACHAIATTKIFEDLQKPLLVESITIWEEDT
ncbi:hypothetical protein PG994_005097 [Apiospora phragmitis]|uniref:Uncharacterized protein n=1 Tax=Apiospora phragmitis TaxID=2905665 RepID=A0ABR1VSH8_9PEZI